MPLPGTCAEIISEMRHQPADIRKDWPLTGSCVGSAPQIPRTMPLPAETLIRAEVQALRNEISALREELAALKARAGDS